MSDETRAIEFTAEEALVILTVLFETNADYPDLSHLRKFTTFPKDDPQGHRVMQRIVQIMANLERRLSAIIDELEPDEAF